jgi:hypothetical protein
MYARASSLVLSATIAVSTLRPTLPCRSRGGVVEPVHQVVERLLRCSFLAVYDDRRVLGARDFERPGIYWLREPCSAFARNLVRNPRCFQPNDNTHSFRSNSRALGLPDCPRLTPSLGVRDWKILHVTETALWEKLSMVVARSQRRLDYTTGEARLIVSREGSSAGCPFLARPLREKWEDCKATHISKNPRDVGHPASLLIMG